MSAEGFITNVLLPNLDLYWVLLAFLIFLYCKIYKRIFVSVLDPSLLSIIGSLFGCSVVVLLFLTKNIKSYYFISYVITQLFFWIGLLAPLKNKTCNVRTIKVDTSFLRIIFLVSLFIFITTTLLGYVILGIPILADSRLDIAANAKGGMGILTRFSLLSMVCLYFSFYYLKIERRSRIMRLLSYISVMFVIMTILLSGSKGSFMQLLFVYFCFAIINKNIVPKLFKSLQKNQYYFFAFASFFALGVLVYTSGLDVGPSLLNFSIRLIGFGDVYWLAYPDETLESVPYVNPFIVLFQSFLGLTRIVPHSEFPEPIGYTLSSMFYTKESLTGANARHNIFGYIYFGFYLSVIFSYLLGRLISRARNNLFSYKGNNQLTKIFIVLIYIPIWGLETDPTLFFSYMTDLLVVIPVVFVFSLFIYYGTNRNSVNNFQ